MWRFGEVHFTRTDGKENSRGEVKRMSSGVMGMGLNSASSI
jgi:hypothetical protein